MVSIYFIQNMYVGSHPATQGERNQVEPLKYKKKFTQDLECCPPANYLSCFR